MNVAIEELTQRITAIATKVQGIKDGQIDIHKTDYLKIIKGIFIGNSIRKKKNVLMISLWLKNRNSFEETHGVNLQIIRRMQSGYKTREVKLMLKNRRR